MTEEEMGVPKPIWGVGVATPNDDRNVVTIEVKEMASITVTYDVVRGHGVLLADLTPEAGKHLDLDERESLPMCFASIETLSLSPLIGPEGRVPGSYRTILSGDLWDTCVRAVRENCTYGRPIDVGLFHPYWFDL